MKAAVIYEPGGPEQLIVQEVPTPTAKPGWSLVKVKGFGINHSEIFTRKGLSPSVSFPRILGIECVGIVEESTDPKLVKGQKIVSIMGEMGRAFDGGYAEYALLPNNQIYPIETSLSWQDLAAVPETYYTAFVAMKNLQIKPTDKVLVRGGTSGVGIAFLKLIKGQYPHINVTGTSRREDKRQLMQDIGFDDVIIDQNNTLKSHQSFDKILELIGPASIKDSFNHINEHGIICSCGQLGNQWFLENFDPIMELKNNSYLTTAYSGVVRHKAITDLIDYVEHYHIDVSPVKVFTLDNIVEAHSYLESHHSFGKVVVLND